MSYGKKPNEAFLQYYGFVDTSYKSDFYTADLLEYVQQKQGIPADRLTTLATNKELLKYVESVSVPRAMPAVRASLRHNACPVQRVQFWLSCCCCNALHCVCSI